MLVFVGNLCIEILMEFECVVAVLVYLKRLIKSSKGQFVLLRENWEDVFLICCVISNKIWDDFHIKNSDYCLIVEGITLERVNELERTYLNLISYRCNVSPHIYSRYHSSIQSWNSKSNLTARGKSDPLSDSTRVIEKSSSRLPVVDEELPTQHTVVAGSVWGTAGRETLQNIDRNPPLALEDEKEKSRGRTIFQFVSNAFSYRGKFRSTVAPINSP